MRLNRGRPRAGGEGGGRGRTQREGPQGAAPPCQSRVAPSSQTPGRLSSRLSASGMELPAVVPVVAPAPTPVPTAVSRLGPSHRGSSLLPWGLGPPRPGVSTVHTFPGSICHHSRTQGVTADCPLADRGADRGRLRHPGLGRVPPRHHRWRGAPGWASFSRGCPPAPPSPVPLTPSLCSLQRRPVRNRAAGTERTDPGEAPGQRGRRDPCPPPPLLLACWPAPPPPTFSLVLRLLAGRQAPGRGLPPQQSRGRSLGGAQAHGWMVRCHGEAFPISCLTSDRTFRRRHGQPSLRSGLLRDPPCGPGGRALPLGWGRGPRQPSAEEGIEEKAPRLLIAAQSRLPARAVGSA